jgi:hypothetical protein
MSEIFFPYVMGVSTRYRACIVELFGRLRLVSTCTFVNLMSSLAKSSSSTVMIGVLRSLRCGGLRAIDCSTVLRAAMALTYSTRQCLRGPRNPPAVSGSDHSAFSTSIQDTPSHHRHATSSSGCPFISLDRHTTVATITNKLHARCAPHRRFDPTALLPGA